MTRLVAGCKVNLGLRVLERRPDGYHALRSIFWPLPFPRDELLLEELPPAAGARVRLEGSGLTATIDPASNTLTRAWAAFRDAAAGSAVSVPGVSLRLRKRIPAGSGLGGGSSDAAALLLWLNARCGHPLDAASLNKTALAVGADVPFFLYNRPSLVGGAGEAVTPLAASPFGDCRPWLVLVCPPLHVSTARAFARLDALRAGSHREANGLTKPATAANGIFRSEVRPRDDARPAPVSDMGNGPGDSPGSVSGAGPGIVPDTAVGADLGNDLEDAVFALHPELAALKDALVREGALAAGMSGSGSGILGLFDGEHCARAAAGRLRSWQLHPWGLRVYCQLLPPVSSPASCAGLKTAGM